MFHKKNSLERDRLASRHWHCYSFMMFVCLFVCFLFFSFLFFSVGDHRENRGFGGTLLD